MSLHIVDGIKFPDSTVTEVLAWIGRRGSGKTYGASKAAEEMHRIGAQFVVLDSVGVWYGLRQPGESGSPGLSIPIFGGLRGDVPLTPTSGALVADVIVDQNLTAIVDTSQFETDADKNRFVFDFVTRLFFKKKSAPSAMHVFLEEAQEYAAQNLQKGEEKMLHAVQRMIRLGRNYGIGASLISQRPQDVSKKVLNQAEVVFAFQLTGPQEIDAVKYWCSEKGYGDDLRTILPKLETGHAHLWSPVLLKLNREVHISQKQTLAAGSTPKAGQSAKRPKDLASIDIGNLTKTMAATIERAKADDPRELKRQIADLQKQLAAKTVQAPAAAPIDKAANEQRLKAAFEKGVNAAKAAVSKSFRKALQEVVTVQKSMQALHVTMHTVTEDIAKSGATPDQSLIATPRQQVMADRTSVITPRRPPQPVTARRTDPGADENGARLPDGERKILTACAQYPQRGCDRTQLTILTGFKRSTRDAYVQRLATKGLVAVGPTITATADGVAALGEAFEPLPVGEELQSYWLDRLPAGEGQILGLLLNRYPHSVSRDDITNETSFKRSTRDAYLQRLQAKRLVDVSGAGVAASQELF